MNKVSIFRAILTSLLFSFSSSTIAIVDEEKNEKSIRIKEELIPSAIEYFQSMQKAYQSKNYEIIYLSNLQKQLEPMQLIHGVVDEQQVSYFRYLNGAIRESLQFAGKISYFEQGTPSYTLQSRQSRHAFANIADFDFEKGQENYDYVILGKARIAGKQSIAIRMISKDEYRNNFVIWCELQTLLPLRLDTVSPSNVLLEQLMVVSLKVSENVNPWLVKITENPRPEMVHIRQTSTEGNSKWEVSWLPPGFVVVKNDKHSLALNEKDPVSYIMLEDGLVTVSIYISAKKLSLDEKQRLVRHGSTVLYTEQRGNTEINIVGDIPIATAKRLVKSMVLVK